MNINCLSFQLKTKSVKQCVEYYYDWKVLTASGTSSETSTLGQTQLEEDLDLIFKDDGMDTPGVPETPKDVISLINLNQRRKTWKNC